MPPVAKKDFGFVLFDVASSKQAELYNGLIKFATFKWFMNSRSVYRLVLFNSAQTSNDKDYPNIYATDVEDFDPLQVSKTIEDAKPGKANWLDALLLGIHHLEEVVTMRGLVTLQLIVFTNLDFVNPPIMDHNKIQMIIDKLNQHDIFLYIIGPNVQLPFTITSIAAVKRCMNELQVDQGNQNLIVAKKLVTCVNNSVICNTKIGANLLISFKQSQGSQPWKVPFSFGNKLTIPAVTTKIIRKDVLLKMSASSPRRYMRTLADDRTVKVEESDIVKGILRHGKFIHVEDDMFRSDTERCFEIIGFTDKKFVPETYLRGEESFYVSPSELNPDFPNATNDDFQAFTHLVNILAESNKYAISKRVYANNNKIRYFVLIPNIEFVPKCFTMTGLPYADFLTPHTCTIPTSPREKIKQDEFFRFFKSMYVDTRDSKAGITLGPVMMIDFHQHKLINAVAKKYLQKEDLDMENLAIDDYEELPENKFLETLRQSWPAKSADDSPIKMN